MKHYENSYPQGNGLVESTNNNLISIIKRIVLTLQRNWHNALKNSLSYHRVTPKPSIGTSPYFLFYGKETSFPKNIYLPTLQLSQESCGRNSPIMQNMIDTLLRLEEERKNTCEKFVSHQRHIKRWFEKIYAGDKEFFVGDLIVK